MGRKMDISVFKKSCFRVKKSETNYEVVNIIEKKRKLVSIPCG